MRAWRVVVILLAAAAVFGDGAAGTPAGLAPLSRPTLPTTAPSDSVAESPCDQASTVGIENCEVRQNLALNRSFDRDTAILWPMLDRLGRQEMAQAQKARLDFVQQECTLDAREFLGGSSVPAIGEGSVKQLDEDAGSGTRRHHGGLV